MFEVYAQSIVGVSPTVSISLYAGCRLATHREIYTTRQSMCIYFGSSPIGLEVSAHGSVHALS